MASPVDAGRNTTNVTTAATAWSVNLPASIASGELLFMFLRTNNANFANPGASGWTRWVNGEASDASNDLTHLFYRWADGTEGATISVTSAGSSKGAAITYRVTGAENPATQVPELSTVAVGTGADPDPGNVNGTGGSKDYLAIVFAGMDQEGVTYTAPSGYSNVQNANSGTTGTPDTNVCIGSAARQFTGSSEDPGTFTAGAPSNGWTAYTILVHPPAAGGSAHSITAADTITLSDSAGKTVGLAKADTVTLSDVVAKAMGLAQADTITLSDAVVKALGKTLADTVTLSDAQAKAIGKTAADTLNLTDDQIILLNGLPAFEATAHLRTLLGIGE